EDPIGAALEPLGNAVDDSAAALIRLLAHRLRADPLLARRGERRVGGLGRAFGGGEPRFAFRQRVARGAPPRARLRDRLGERVALLRDLGGTPVEPPDLGGDLLAPRLERRALARRRLGALAPARFLAGDAVKPFAPLARFAQEPVVLALAR